MRHGHIKSPFPCRTESEGNTNALHGLAPPPRAPFPGRHAPSPARRPPLEPQAQLHGPLPFNLMRSAAVAGARYGLSCLGCSAALMVAMVLLGMSSLWWAAILGIVVLHLQARASTANAI